MNIVRIEKAARRQADRLPARVTSLVDESSDFLRHKLDEAVDLIHGAAAQLAEEGQALVKAQVKHAAILAEQGRKQAEIASRKAVKAASGAAEESYVGFKGVAGRNPLAVAAAAIGLGLVIGFLLRPRPIASAAATEEIAEPQPAAAPRARKPAKVRARRPASTQPTTH